MESLNDVFFSESECLDDAGELCSDVGATAASAAVADSANHNQVTEFSFADVVCWINFWVCGEAEKIIKVSISKVVDKSSDCWVFVVSVCE